MSNATDQSTLTFCVCTLLNAGATAPNPLPHYPPCVTSRLGRARSDLVLSVIGGSSLFTLLSLCSSRATPHALARARQVSVLAAAAGIAAAGFLFVAAGS